MMANDVPSHVQIRNALSQLNRDIQEAELNGTDFNINSLILSRSGNLIHFRIIQHLLTEMTGQLASPHGPILRSLRDYFYELCRVFPEDEITPRLVYRCINAIANHFNWPRNNLPVIARQSRGFFTSQNVFIIHDGVPLPILPNSWNPIPQDWEMRTWNIVETNAELSFVCESNSISTKLVQPGGSEPRAILKKLKKTIIWDLGGYGSENCMTFGHKIAHARIVNEIGGPVLAKEVPTRGFADNDLYGVDILFVTRLFPLREEAIQNQEEHIVDNLIPLFHPNIDTDPNSVVMTKIQRRPLLWLWKRLVLLGEMGANQTEINRWQRPITQIETSKKSLPHASFPDLINFVLSHPDMQQFLLS